MKLAMNNSNAGCRTLACFTLALATLPSAFASSVPSSGTNREVMVRDVTTIEGVRDNLLVGYGLVVGLHGTGDTQQTIFTIQTLANAMQKMGVLISPSSAVVKNVAAVFVTASLPPFARPGAKLDVTVASVGDAHSLDGGVLLMSALRGPDGQVYAEAQGSLLMGGYSAGSGTNRKEVNASNVGTIPEGAIIERDTAVDLSGFKTVSLLLHNPDFGTAMAIADAVNQEFDKTVATALDSRRVDISVAGTSEQSVPQLIARVQKLVLKVQTPAKIVINERTGTIVMGGNVKLSPVGVIHGSLSIQVTTDFAVVEAPVPPESNSGQMRKGPGNQNNAVEPVLVPETTVNADEGPAQTMRLDEGANVDELVTGLHAIGATAHDVVAILEAIKAEGGMQAELEVQ
ncbi:MAG: flagellar basal body P-ring protein FlgI [Terracidiphilus sp.]|jgi:flagellar P-ring protein precursor FlgI